MFEDGAQNEQWLSTLDVCNGARIRAARGAVETVQKGMLSRNGDKVKIHSGPLADVPSKAMSSAMPSIVESPLEQDFTTSGTPSKLGCPFASMENRRLSSHAASVVSKYRPNGTATPRSSVSRINGRSSSVAAASLKAALPQGETCAMVSPTKSNVDLESVPGSTGVCPIRFLDDHSPEDVAAYFEEHKHELPRSHEVCVKRYQSNEDSIRQLDAKYGNLVSMIKGLGQKHAPMLPGKAEGEVLCEDDSGHDRASDERVRRWARTVSGDEMEVQGDEPDDDRLPRFDRPLKDVRIGESPSRPWGIQVPISAERRDSDLSSAAAAAPVLQEPAEPTPPNSRGPEMQNDKQKGTCPFGFDARQKPKVPPEETTKPSLEEQLSPVFVNPREMPDGKVVKIGGANAPMVFNGPVFIGYSMEQALALVQGIAAKDK